MSSSIPLSQEDFTREVLTRLASIDATLRSVVEQQKVANGRTSKNEDSTDTLKDRVRDVEEALAIETAKQGVRARVPGGVREWALFAFAAISLAITVGVKLAGG